LSTIVERVKSKLQKVIKTGQNILGVEMGEKKKSPFPFPELPEELPKIEEWLPAPPPHLPLPKWLVKRIEEAKKE